MKLTQLQPQRYLYHVTFTRNVPKIKKIGVVPLQRSNWVRGRGGKRYNEDAGIFAFEHPIDAFKWALRMEFDFAAHEKGKPEISIVRINVGDQWKQDPSDDPILQMGQGRSLRSERAVSPNDVIDSFRLEDFGKPGTLNVTQQEWFDQVQKKLTQ